MLSTITIKDARFLEALRVQGAESLIFPDNTNDLNRLIGILAEMGVAEYLTARYRSRMIIPVGLMARTQMVSHGAFNEGDVMTITRRNNTHRLTHIYEVKGSSVGKQKCQIRQDHVESYHEQGVSAVFFCSVDVHEKDNFAIVNVLEQARPDEILNHWIGCKSLMGMECYQHPDYY